MPATHEQISAAMKQFEYDESAIWVIKWQFRALGGFETALAEAIIKADEENLYKLRQGFPVQVDGYRRWAQGNLGDEFRKAGLSI